MHAFLPSLVILKHKLMNLLMKLHDNCQFFHFYQIFPPKKSQIFACVSHVTTSLRICYCNLANLIQKVPTLLCKGIHGLSHMSFLFKVCGIKTLQILIFYHRQIKTSCYQIKSTVDICWHKIFHIPQHNVGGALSLRLKYVRNGPLASFRTTIRTYCTTDQIHRTQKNKMPTDMWPLERLYWSLITREFSGQKNWFALYKTNSDSTEESCCGVSGLTEAVHSHPLPSLPRLIFFSPVACTWKLHAV